jgi:hypothetical protein
MYRISTWPPVPSTHAPRWHYAHTIPVPPHVSSQSIDNRSSGPADSARSVGRSLRSASGVGAVEASGRSIARRSSRELDDASPDEVLQVG